ncbi:unnamed protein product [Fusarium graminearum]|nr:unnamed protein product [Fusarium graminearum]
MSNATPPPRKSIATGSENHGGRTACENSLKAVTSDFGIIRAASIGLTCMADDLVNCCAPLSGTGILKTSDPMELLLGLIRYGVRSWLQETENVKTLLEIDMAQIDATVIRVLC